MSRQPEPVEIMDFLAGSAIRDPVDPSLWRIHAVAYPEETALKLAELCMLTGQRLTAVATVDGQLNMARRIVALENQVERLERASLRDQVCNRLKDGPHG